MVILSRSEEVYMLSIWELKDNAYGVTIKRRVRYFRMGASILHWINWSRKVWSLKQRASRRLKEAAERNSIIRLRIMGKKRCAQRMNIKNCYGTVSQNWPLIEI